MGLGITISISAGAGRRSKARKGIDGGKSIRGSVRKYVRQFQSLMLEIGNMAEEDKVFRFEMGFQEWARKELQKRSRTWPQQFE